MSRRAWFIVLAAVGVAFLILVGVLSNQNQPTKAEAANSLCSSLLGLQSSVKQLTSLPSTATKSDYQADVTAVQDSWSQVKSDAQAVQNAPTGDLDSAWDNFSSTLKNVPNDASVSDAVNDITQSAQQLVSAAESTASQVNCTTGSTTTTS
jgi:predicted Zn-dependent protease